MLRASLLFLALAGAANAGPVYYRSDANRKADLPFSDAVRAGGLVYLNNQIAVTAGGTVLTPGGVPAELRDIMSKIDIVLAAAGLTRADLVSCLVGLKDMDDLHALNEEWPKYFAPDRRPARNVIGAKALPFGASVTVQCVAAARDKGMRR